MIVVAVHVFVVYVGHVIVVVDRVAHANVICVSYGCGLRGSRGCGCGLCGSHVYQPGLTLEEKGVVLRLRSLVKAHVSRLCGDLVASDMWRKYGAFNSVTNNFDFHPDW